MSANRFAKAPPGYPSRTFYHKFLCNPEIFIKTYLRLLTHLLRFSLNFVFFQNSREFIEKFWRDTRQAFARFPQGCKYFRKSISRPDGIRASCSKASARKVRRRFSCRLQQLALEIYEAVMPGENMCPREFDRFFPRGTTLRRGDDNIICDFNARTKIAMLRTSLARKARDCEPFVWPVHRWTFYRFLRHFCVHARDRTL